MGLSGPLRHDMRTTIADRCRLMILASSQLQTALMFADLLVLVVMSLAFFGFILWVERILLTWHVSVRRENTGA
jgi:hypothetical protein